MSGTILLVAAALVGPSRPVGPAHVDTIVSVRAGDRFVVENLSGEFHVGTWDRNEVQAVSMARGVGVGLRASSGRVELERADWGEWDDDDRYRITVPDWMPVELSGTEMTVTVQGVGGGVSVHTAEGDVRVQDVTGPVRLQAVDGVVRVEGVRGDVEARSGDDDVWVVGVEGNVAAESVDGSVTLRDVLGDRVSGVTVDGDVRFEGPLRPGGQYRFVTHDGDVVADVRGQIDASVTVSTFDGEFHVDFPITVERIHGGHEYQFTLGSGSASLSLQAFDGDIRLRNSR